MSKNPMKNILNHNQDEEWLRCQAVGRAKEKDSKANEKYRNLGHFF